MKWTKGLLMLALSAGTLWTMGCGKESSVSANTRNASTPAAKLTVSEGTAGGARYHPASRGIVEGRAEKGELTVSTDLIGGRSEEQRGEYLVAIASCVDCHTPVGPTGPMMDQFLAGGNRFEEAFGVLYTSNLTPDEETGLGGWTDEEIARAIREGVDKDGDPLFPVMPSAFYRGMSDADVKALVAYLRTLPPVRNKVPEPELNVPIPPPLGPLTAPVPNPPASDPVAVGKYLVDHVSICAECHTPFTPEGAPDFSRYLAGGREFVGPWGISYSSNLTPDEETGIGKWTDAQIVAALREGVDPGGERLHPPMPLYGMMADRDVATVVAYLRIVPAVANEVPEYEPPGGP